MNQHEPTPWIVQKDINLQVYEDSQGKLDSPFLLNSMWTYDQALPDAISIVFPRQPEVVEWVISRELFTDTIDGEFDVEHGIGDVVMSKENIDGSKFMRTRFESPNGRLAFLGSLAAATEFRESFRELTDKHQLDHFRRVSTDKMLDDLLRPKKD